MNTLDKLKLAAICIDNMAMEGVSVVQRSGTPELIPELESLGKDHITPKMDPRRNDFSGSDCFWLLLYRDGECIGCLGSRVEDIGRESYPDYWRRVTARHYPEAGPLSFAHLMDAEMLGLSGPVAYVGELFIKSGCRGSQSILRNLMMLYHITAHTKWQINGTYAFFRDRDARAAMGQKYHFTECIPDFQRWANPPEGRGETEYLFALPGKKFNHLVSYYVDKPDRL